MPISQFKHILTSYPTACLILETRFQDEPDMNYNSDRDERTNHASSSTVTYDPQLASKPFKQNRNQLDRISQIQEISRQYTLAKKYT